MVMHLTQVVEFLRHTDELKVAKDLLSTFAKYAKTTEQCDEVAMLFEKIKAYPESIEMLNKCLAMTVNPAQTYSIRANLAKVYNHINEPFKSLTYSEINIELNPDDYESKMEAAFSHYLAGDGEKSYQLQKSLYDNPNIPENVRKRIHFNMGTFEMERGDFAGGLEKMILGGKKIGIWQQPKRPFPQWDGKATDRTVLVFAEAGIGDEIINIRFMDEFEKRGIKAAWVGTREDTNELFRSNGYNVVSSVHQLDPMEQYYYVESMSLPIALGIQQDQLWDGPYLLPKKSYINKWKQYFDDRDIKKFIAIKWSGNPYYDHDLHRVVPKDQLVECISSARPDYTIVSLQLGEVDSLPIQSWEDTLAIQSLAQWTVTSCTSTAHSGSASGANVIVLPPISRYYPWVKLNDDNTSMWYGKNTKVFPQTKWKDWSQPLSSVFKTIRE